MLKEKEISTMGGEIKRGRIGYTPKKIKKEEKVLELQKRMKHMLREQKECVTALREGYDRHA